MPPSILADDTNTSSHEAASTLRYQVNSIINADYADVLAKMKPNVVNLTVFSLIFSSQIRKRKLPGNTPSVVAQPNVHKVILTFFDK